MNWKKGIGYGALLWLIMFALVSALLNLYYLYTWMPIIIALVTGLISFILAKYIKPTNAKLALSYGLLWVIVGLVLDFFITKQFNPNIFSAWSLWLGYILVLLAPLLVVKKAPII